MANSEHLAKLKEGVDTWNDWRAANPKTRPDLSEAELRGIDLGSGALFNANLGHSAFLEGDLIGAKPSRARSGWVLLRRFRLDWDDSAKAYPISADLGNADLRGAKLSDADLNGADLHEANLGEADLRGANLSRTDLRGANLHGATLTDANLNEAYLTGMDLRGVDLSGANLRAAQLNGASLSGVTLREANLRAAQLSGTDLGGADLMWADLSEADLNGANFVGVKLARTTFGNNDLSTVSGLDTVKHEGGSTIGIDTIYRSHGKIPLAFLRGAGVPENFIEYMGSLTGKALEFYSCFISYSTEDQEFADRLHADLQNKGVRCWFAPHDIQAGKKIHEQVDEAIRRYERLLLILSTNSMKSPWVKTEIRKARKREIEENRRVLFPVSIVPFTDVRMWKSFYADEGIDLAEEIREYYLPDFSNWKNHDSYAKELERLLRDLKTEGSKAA